MSKSNELKINESVLRLFKSYITPIVSKEETVTMIPKEEGLKYGIYLEEPIEKPLFDEIVKQYGIDGYLLNQTFHKSFDKVANSDMETLLMEQLIHYFTTYGLEDILDKKNDVNDYLYIPNEKLEVPELDQENIKLTYIRKIEKKELQDRITNLVESGIALSRITVNDCITLSEYITCKLDDIKNKEVRIALYDKYEVTPEDPVEFLRYFIFKLTDKTLLIKDEDTLNALREAPKADVLKYLKRYVEGPMGYEKLAEIFNRFKPIFVTLKLENLYGIYRFNDEKYKIESAKTLREIRRIINKVSKLSKKYHKPLVLRDNLGNLQEWLESIKNKRDREDILLNELKKNSIWRIIRAASFMCYETNLYREEKAYKIRNGKVYLTKDTRRKFSNTWAKPIILEYISKVIAKNIEGKSIYIPDNVDYMLPQSEKQFVGNIPFNSIIKIPKKAGLILGIHWLNVLDKKGNEQRTDLDIKLSSNKYQISWNTMYRDEDRQLLFSGDMTSAPIKDGGAAEYIYIGEDIRDTIMSFTVNSFNLTDQILFEFIIANAPCSSELEGFEPRTEAGSETIFGKSRCNYIIDPKDIIAKIPCMMERGQSEQNIGMLYTTEDNDFCFSLTGLSTRNVPVSRDNKFDSILRNYILNLNKNNEDLTLNLILGDYGTVFPEPIITTFEEFNLVKVNGETKLVEVEKVPTLKDPEILEKEIFKRVEKPVDIDLSIEKLTKDTILNLLKEEK